MKKMIMVNGSPRKNGADAQILEKVGELASKYGYETELFNVYDLQLNGCKSCYACKKTGSCVQKDEMNEIISKIKESDMIVFATPVYFGGETGPLKTFIDRLYPTISYLEDGSIKADVGTLNKGAVLVTCGAPDGPMRYNNVVIRIIGALNGLGVKDVTGAVVPVSDVSKLIESDYTQGFLNNVEFQIDQ